MALLGQVVRNTVIACTISVMVMSASASAHTARQDQRSFTEMTGITLMAHARAGEDLPKLTVGGHNSYLWPNILYGLNAESSVSLDRKAHPFEGIRQ